MQPSKFLTREQKIRMQEAIRKAESNTSGEIRVHIDKQCLGDPLDRAAYLFEKIGMQKTNLRNGVLFYLALDDRKFAILGDAGINSVVPSDFWNNIRDIVTGKFKEGDFTGGLETGILMAGEQLKNHFPFQKTDINELPDEISFGEK